MRPKTGRKSGGSAPPLLKKVLSALATFCWLMAQTADPRVSRKIGGEVQDHVGRGVAQARAKPAGRLAVVRLLKVPLSPPAAERMV